ncbi:SAM-dependent methyltransferase, partial [Propionibacterium freudenreichii]|nr:SAM-dependent methyltransferase [Propionibacterium freudenreichii]
MRATPTEHTHYTHGYAPSVLASHRARTARNSAGYLLPLLRGGMSLLDVGSGAGTITADLAALVAPGHVTALEVTAE